MLCLVAGGLCNAKKPLVVHLVNSRIDDSRSSIIVLLGRQQVIMATTSRQAKYLAGNSRVLVIAAFSAC